MEEKNLKDFECDQKIFYANVLGSISLFLGMAFLFIALLVEDNKALSSFLLFPAFVGLGIGIICIIIGVIARISAGPGYIYGISGRMKKINEELSELKILLAKTDKEQLNEEVKMELEERIKKLQEELKRLSKK